MAARHILYVADEQADLKSFRDLFREVGEIHEASSTEEARRLLREHDITLVLVDQDFRGTTGLEFLRAVAEEFPTAATLTLDLQWRG